MREINEILNSKYCRNKELFIFLLIQHSQEP
jgi:hypothetical protein